MADYVELHVHNHHRLARVLRQSNRSDEITTHYAQAFDFQSRLVRRHSEVLVHWLWKARIARNYAPLLDDRDEARRLLESAIAELEELTPSESDLQAVARVLDDL